MSKSLGEFEQAILFSLLELEEDHAYGVRIRETIEDRTGRAISSGAVYTALDRMEDRGLVESSMGEPTANRGGRRKRMYRLKPEGAETLLRSVRRFQQMSAGLLPRLEARLEAGDGGRRRGA
jgi:DNA-binding PadR family transcriptional regulator